MIRKICDCAAIDYGTTDRLMILFSSKPAMRRDVFDYVTFVQNMPHTKLFLRDAQSDYLYHIGIQGLTSSIDETVEFLKVFIKRMKPKRVTFMGMSGGGYGATLHAHLVGRDPECRVDDVHVQSSISFLDPAVRDRLGGGERFTGLFQNLADYVASRGEEHRYADLAKVVEESPGAVRLLRMYYAHGELIDRLQAENLARFPHVQAVAHPSQSHMMLGMTVMREGTLYRDIEMSVEELLQTNPPADPVPHMVPSNLGLAGRVAVQA